MSFDEPHGPATETVDGELDVALLSSLVAELPADDSELLARLDSAHNVANGVEAKVDEILGRLDDLLTSLEPKGSDKPQEITIPSSES